MLRQIVAIVLASAAPCAMPAAPEASAAGAGNAVAGARFAEEAFGASVTNQTITVAGQEFYRAFCAFWHDKPFSERYAVAVRENPSVRRGNQVVVEFAGRTVFQGILPNSRSNIKPMSERAVEIAYDTAFNAHVQRLLFREQDLGPDEI
ncbi:MAG: CsgE family curli-type amyloid fiber assembly protein [Massilia sp.]